MSNRRERDLSASPDLSLLTDHELISLRAQIEAEMRKRSIAYSVGEVGEALAIGYFNSTPGCPTLLAAPAGTKNVDALSRDGERYSIKTLLTAKKTGTVYPDPHDRERQLFEYLLVVHLHPDYSLKSIHRFSWKLFSEIRSWDRRMNAWYLGASRKVLNLGELLTGGN